MLESGDLSWSEARQVDTHYAIRVWGKLADTWIHESEWGSWAEALDHLEGLKPRYSRVRVSQYTTLIEDAELNF
jgi:hypothetical protein